MKDRSPDEKREIIFRNRYWDKIGVDKKTLINAIDFSLKDEDIFEQVIKAQAVMRGKTIYGEKTPDHAFFIQELIHMYPDAVIIHMIRDPRAVAISQILRVAKNHFPYSNDVTVNMARKWNKTTFIALKNRRRLGRYLEVRYEDLIMFPESTLTDVCDLIGVELEEKMLRPPVTNSSFKTDQKQGFNKDSLMRWKNDLSLINKLYIDYKCRNYMKKLGYTRDGFREVF
jgi:hypothetical protein